MGYEVSIINEATKKGNLTTTQLKQRTELQKQKQYIDQTQKVLAECNTKTSKALQELRGIIDQVQGYKALKNDLESKIEDLQTIHQETMEQIADIASKSNLYNDLLQRNILAGNYQYVDDLQNAIYDAQEAQELIDYTQGIDIYQNDPSL